MSDARAIDATADEQARRDEWVGAIKGLVSQAEDWSRANGWHPERQSKVVRDDPTGRYEVPQLWIAPHGRVVFLDPTSRFLPGGKGIADLYLWPEMDGVMIPRTEDGWHVHLPSGRFDVERLPWSKQAFERAVAWLIEA